MIQRRTLLTGMTLSGLAGLAACSDDGPDGKPRHTIAVVPRDGDSEWTRRMEAGVQRFADDTSQRATLHAPDKADATTQADLIRGLLREEVEALCVVPVDPAALEPVLAEAMEAGVSVITHEAASLKNVTYDLEPFDADAFGAFLMDSLAEAMGEEGLYTTITTTNPTQKAWADAAVAHQAQKYPHMSLLEAAPRLETADSVKAAHDKAKGTLLAHTDVRGVLSTAPSQAQGAATAIQETGLQGKTVAVGTGLPGPARKLVTDGPLAALAFWDPAETAVAMCTLARRVLDQDVVKAPLNLAANGYAAMTAADNAKVFQGSGWLYATKDNIGDFAF